jgi:hypothetical protein
MVACALAAVAAPRLASAQYNAPPLSRLAIGENYHVEIAGTLWNPTLVGTVSSEEFGLKGTPLDFTTDLDFQQTRFKDFRIVLRPARKHRLRAQYTPVAYSADTVLERTVTFRGITFDAVPISSSFEWKVWRFGYEYDFIYRNRGFLGVLFEGRYTQFSASLAAPGRLEFTSAKAPLPAIGIVGRAYVAPSVALNFEVSGMKLPNVDARYAGNYYDWNINGTINLSNYAGVEIGWRRMTTFIHIDSDEGDFKFQGMWFGAALRY